MDEETREIIDGFVAEASEAIDEVEPLLIEMSASATGEADGDILAKVFRSFHSMKGAAGFLHLDGIQRVTHQAEAVLVELRAGNLATEPAMVEALCHVLDAVRARLPGIYETGQDQGDPDELAEIAQRLDGFLRSATPAAADDVGSPSAVGPAEGVPDVVPVGDLVEPFKVEGWDLLDTCEQHLLLLETDPEATELLSSAFGLLHSFKGNCGFMGFADLEQLAHAAENLLGAVRHREVPASRDVIGALLQTLDTLRTVVGRLPIEPRIPDAAIRVARLERVEKAARERAHRTRIGDILVDRGALSSDALDEVLRQGGKPVGAALVDRGLISPADLQAGLNEQAQRRGVPVRAEGPRAERPQTSLRVDVGKLDTLMDLVGELIIAETAVIHAPDDAQAGGQEFLKALAQLDRITRSLQDVAMSLRMVPIEATFRKMVRVVRDVANKQGKQVSLEIVGEETEVDKTVAEVVGDPLVHLLRNAVDHGIEPPEERERLGKPVEGRLRLSASHVGGEIWVQIQDDGAGISRERVIAKAIDRGLVPASAAATLSDAEVFAFIFEAGFSTAAAVTDISGRGVGMDVVRRQIERVKGRIDVASAAGQGTTITLRIPLTLAIIEGMLVSVGQTSFTIPLLCIRESVVPRASDVTRLSDGQEIVRIRGQLLPVLRMHKYYGIAPAHERLEDGILLVVEDSGQTVCLFVDALIGQRQTVIKSLSGFLGDPRSLSGCTVLGDGRISLILDVARLVGAAPHAA